MQIEWWGIIPFALMLLSIAIAPLVPALSHYWEWRRVQLLVALVLGVPVAIWFLLGGESATVVHALVEYGQFITLLFALFGFYGLFMAATEGVEKALVADLAPTERRGTAFGWFNLTAGVMLLPASLVFGWLWQSVASWVAFGFSGVCALLAAVLLRFWVFREGRPQPGT